MLFTVQQLVARRDLRLRSTLTDLHDSNTAWNGLGNAVLTMWRNAPLPSSIREPGLSSKPSRTLIAVLYLGGIAVLNMSIPALASIEAFHATEDITIQTQGGPDWNTMTR